MTIETTLETALSAKERGFRYVRSEHVAVVSVTGARRVSSISLRIVLKACVARFEAALHGWLLSLPHHHIVLFASTAFSAQHNALSRRRGIWGSEGLSWLPREAARSDSVRINREDGEGRFAGLAEIDEASFFEAAEFVRTHAGSFLTVSPRGNLTEERVRSMHWFHRSEGYCFPSAVGGAPCKRMVKRYIVNLTRAEREGLELLRDKGGEKGDGRRPYRRTNVKKKGC